MNDFYTIFYGILFEPVSTFRNMQCNKPYKLPLAIVILSSAFLLLLSDSYSGFASIFSFVAKCITVIIYWLFFAFFIDLMSKLFQKEGNYEKLLTLTAFSFLPYIFIAPIKLLKNLGGFAYDISILLFFGIWIWSIALQILAVSETYNVPRRNAIVILLLPFIGTILYCVWLIDFFSKIFQISLL